MPGIRSLHLPSRVCYGPLRMRGTPPQEEGDQEVLTGTALHDWPAEFPDRSRFGSHHYAPTQLYSINPSSTSSDNTPNLPELREFAIPESFPKRARRYCALFLGNMFISIFVIFCGVALSLGLGFYSLMVLKPAPVIDKSIEAFNIPNHISSRRQDALEEAMAEWKSRLLNFRYRKRRDVSDVRDAEYKQMDFHNYNNDFMNNSNAGGSSSNASVKMLRSSGSKLNIGAERNNTRAGGGHPGDRKATGTQVPRQLHTDNLPGIASRTIDIYTGMDEHQQAQLQQVSVEDFRRRLTLTLDRDWQEAAAEEEDLQQRRDNQEHKPSSHSNSTKLKFRSRAEKSLRHKRDAADPNIRRIYGRTQVIRRWKMMLVYLAQGDDDPNVFTEERLETVRQVEEAIKRHPDYTNFCHIDYDKWEGDGNLDLYNGCAPLNSLLTYFYPSTTADGKIHYDGLGTELADINKTLAFAMTKESFFWFVDDRISSANHRSRLLRTEVHFGVPLPGYLYYSDRKDEQLKKYIDFIITYIDLLSAMSTEKVRVLYGGNELFDYEVDATFWSDLRLSLLTLAFIVLFMFILTSFSAWLTLWGMASIVLSFPLAFFVYRYVFGVLTLGILNGVAAFVIIGIGVDDVFVFVNTFRHAHHIRDRGERMLHTLMTAGKATFFTSFTTAAAFAANVASSIPAIHDFGLFMSLIVSCCWIMVVWMMPAVINIWARLFARCEHSIYAACSQCHVCSQHSTLDLPSEIGHYLGPESAHADSEVNVTDGIPSTEKTTKDDERLLYMDDLHDHDGGWPIYLGMLRQMLSDDDDPLLKLESELDESIITDEVLPQEVPPEGCGLTNQLQALLYYLVAKPVVRMRWAIGGVFLGLLLVSLGLMVQLKPATKPPQLFNHNTNLQLLMDLSTNFSDSDITCDECSAFYMESPVTPGNSSNPAQNPGGINHPNPSGNGGGSRGDGGNGVSASSTRRPRATTPAPTPTHSHRTTASNAQQPPADPSNGGLPTVPSMVTPGTTSSAISPHYDPCANGACDNQQSRPNLEVSAVVYIVFGIKDIDRTNVSYQHVLTERGTVEYDPDFEGNFSMNLNNLNIAALQDLCRLCHVIANNTDLVKPSSTQCIPQYGLPSWLLGYFNKIPECHHLPENSYTSTQNGPSRAVAGMTMQGMQWLAFAVESTTYKGQSYFTAYNEYQKWEAFIEYIKAHKLSRDSVLQTIYQTSEFWENVMMEVVAVSSAIYGLLLSMIICVTAVAIFTGHILLLGIVVSTILGTICMVVAIFYLVGWEMGAVEAVSLSILVGSSVDYCVHLVEGYLIAGSNPPASVSSDPGKLRRWRTLVAVSHIGVSITSSALTTIVAAIPLTQTTIQPFSKFGQIVTINTSVSITYTCTACVAMLALLAPAKFTNNWRSVLIATVATTTGICVLILILYILSQCGLNIPAPNGENLF